MAPTAVGMDGESESGPEYAFTPAPPSASSEIPLPAPKRAEDSRAVQQRPVRLLPHQSAISATGAYPVEYDKKHVPLIQYVNLRSRLCLALGRQL
jgi:hypothetical protein